MRKKVFELWRRILILYYGFLYVKDWNDDIDRRGDLSNFVLNMENFRMWICFFLRIKKVCLD